MGTRGLTKVIYNGEPVIAQYGQWDHYPDGQGLDALRFLTDPNNVAALRHNITLVRDITKEESDKINELAGIDKDAQFINMDQAAAWKRLAPQLSRDMGSKILNFIASAEDEVLVSRDIEFEKDRLFCEGVITVNLDDSTFTWSDGGYAESPVRNFVYPLDELPSEEKFLEDTDYGDEEDY